MLDTCLAEIEFEIRTVNYGHQRAHKKGLLRFELLIKAKKGL